MISIIIIVIIICIIIIISSSSSSGSGGSSSILSFSTCARAARPEIPASTPRGPPASRLGQGCISIIITNSMITATITSTATLTLTYYYY